MNEATSLPRKLLKWALPNGWGPVDVGWLVTILWLLFVEWLAFQPSSSPDEYSNKLDEFFSAPTSQIGDTLAGVFAVLALVWIIVTVFLQSHELKEQRKEFRAQRKATQDMAKSMAAQAVIFEDEKRQRNEAYARTQVEQLYPLLKEKVLEVFSKYPKIYFSETNVIEFRVQDHIDRTYSSGAMIKAQDTLTLLKHVTEALEKLMKRQRQFGPKIRSNEITSVRNCLEALNKNLVLTGQATQMKYSFVELREVQAYLETCLENK